MKTRVLCIDDDQDQCDLLQSSLSRMGFSPSTTTSPGDALDLAVKEAFDVILTDLGMGEMDGLALCEQMIATRPGIPVIVLTGLGSMESAISAMRAGAYDFLTKPVEPKLLQIAVARAAQHRRLKGELERLQDAQREPVSTAHIVGESPAIARVNDLIGRVGKSDASVLIHGETGTGKELVARAVHAAGSRATGPFVALNCAAVPPSLLESELFGHARGAFTDAKTARQGLFVEASGGTLFLDEIGDMPMEMQAKLLRALQERKVRPVGTSGELPFDARIVSATHRDLEVEVEERRFRQDLYYRINVVRIDVPKLSERGSDILKLAAFFLERSGAERHGQRLTLSPLVAERLLAYDWPGNVRELENCIDRAVALARFDQITVEDLPERIRAYRSDRFSVSASDPNDIVSLQELEKRYIARVLKLLGGNKARAAALLGLDRRTLYRKLEKYEGTERQDGGAQ
ncbi:MAG: sigma-54 dependent transcriptional regulator [Polyangiaceae bacterium]